MFLEQSRDYFDSFILAEACLKNPSLFKKETKKPSWFPKELPEVLPSFYFRYPNTKIAPIGDKVGLWLPLSCAIAFVAASSATTGGGPIVNGASQDSSGANFIIVNVAEFGSTASVVTDSKSNTYTPLSGWSTSGYRNHLTYKTNANVGSSHTFSTDQSNFAVISVISLSGVDVFDQESVTGSGSANTNKPGALTPAVADSVFITGLVTTATTVTFLSIDSSFIMVGELASALCGAIAYFYPSSGSKDPTWAQGGANLGSTMAVFKPSGGAVGRITNAQLRIGVG